MRALSNNHLLADRPSIIAKLRDVRIGDQVRVSADGCGVCAQPRFRIHAGHQPDTEDSGNGACETIYVQEVEVLRPAAAMALGYRGQRLD